MNDNELNKLNHNFDYLSESHRRIQTQINDLVLDAGESNQEVVQARGGHQVLNDRLNSIDSQLAQKADENDVFLKRYGININDFDEETRRTFLEAQGIDVNYVLGRGNVKNENIANNAVTADKTDFARKGKNLFNGVFTRGIIVTGSSQQTSQIEERPGGYSAIVNLDKGGTYTITKGSTADRFTVVATVGEPEVGGEHRFIANYVHVDHRTVTLEGDEDHLLIYLSTPTQDVEPIGFQVEEGTEATGYEPPNYVDIKFTDKSIEGREIGDKEIDYNHLAMSGKGKNLFDGDFKNWVITGAPPTPFIEPRESGYSAIAKLEKGGTYTISKGTTADRFRVVATVGYPQLGQNGRYVANLDSPEYRTITLEGDEDHIIVYLSSPDQNILPEKFQIEEGTEATEYEDYRKRFVDLKKNAVKGYHIGDKQIEKRHLNFNIDQRSDKTYYIEDNLYGEYEPNFDFVHPDDIVDVMDYYAMFDDLVTRHPEYVTRTLLGTANMDLPIYQYEFNPAQIWGISRPIPKIIVTHGVHGMEKKAHIGGTRFWIDLCDNWHMNKLLRALRWNVRFIVVPAANPSSFNLNQRKNSNGVDIARNFSDGWNQEGDNGDPESMYYAGPYPQSEIETQILDSWMDEHLDALFAIDVHNYTSLSVSNSVLWTGSNDDFINKISGGYVQMMSSVAQGKYQFEGRQGQALGYVAQSVRAGSISNQWHSKGVKAAVLEFVAFMNHSQEDVQELIASGLGNYVLTSLRHLI